MERLAFNVADFGARHMTLAAKAYNSVVMNGLVWSCGGRRLHVHGVEHLEGFDKTSRVLLVANHRSFFDFFVVMGVTFWHTRLSRRIFFPVRGTFFYDSPVGPFVNAAMSAMRMFPPVMRESSKRSFNLYSVERCIDELKVPGTILGVHPEGTRNKGDDPYALLPAQPGIGRIALGDHGAAVIPLFVLGMHNSLPQEFVWNWTAPGDHRIDVHVGPPLDFSDLRPQAKRARAMKAAADRCMDAIRSLAEDNRRLRASL
jgi:1-acyl-sn-glycerol-3-phosphate acyltransferase